MSGGILSRLGGHMQSEFAARLKLEAEIVRRGLEAMPPRCWKGVFRMFPVGCHRPAAAVLGLWLARAGFERVEWMWDALMKPGNREHCWVEVDGVIVDVTGDRFPSEEPRRPPVVVTRDQRWYRTRFHKARRLPIDVRRLNLAPCSRREAGELVLRIEAHAASLPQEAARLSPAGGSVASPHWSPSIS